MTAILGEMALVPGMGHDWPVAVTLGGLRMPSALFCGTFYVVAGLALHLWARRRLRSAAAKSGTATRTSTRLPTDRGGG